MSKAYFTSYRFNKSIKRLFHIKYTMSPTFKVAVSYKYRRMLLKNQNSDVNIQVTIKFLFCSTNINIYRVLKLFENVNSLQMYFFGRMEERYLWGYPDLIR